VSSDVVPRTTSLDRVQFPVLWLLVHRCWAAFCMKYCYQLNGKIGKEYCYHFTLKVNRNIAINFTVQVNRIMTYRLDREVLQLDWFNYMRRTSLDSHSVFRHFLYPSFFGFFDIFIILIASYVLIRSNGCYFTNQRWGRSVLNLVPKKNSFSTGNRAEGKCLSILFIPGIIISNLQ
jgi:hypothetical protein